jgi:hypothetical protein
LNASFLTGAATLRALLILGFALVALGLSNGEVLAQFSGDRIREALFFFAVTPALAWVLARLTRLDFARALILLLLAVYFGMAGLSPTIATVLTALAAIAIGGLLLPEDAQARPWLALLLGFACLAGRARLAAAVFDAPLRRLPGAVPDPIVARPPRCSVRSCSSYTPGGARRAGWASTAPRPCW